MEIRKVQVTGGSSYVITLPKEWVLEQKIRKNDPLGLIAQPDGTLLLTSNTSEEGSQRTKELDIDEIDDPTYLYRLLLGIYIAGYSNIIIRSKERIAPFIRDSIIKFTQVAIGPEIMEEDIGIITIKDMLNPAQMPFEKTIQRMYILVRTMHEDAMTSLQNSDQALAEEVMTRDNDVDRLHLLVARQSNMILRDSMLSKKMGVTPEDAIHYFIISRILERVGDHAAKLESSVIPLIKGKKPIDRKIVQKITDASTMALGILENSVEALLNKDLERAHRTIESVSKLSPKCEAIAGHPQKKEGPAPIALSYIAESIRRTGEYSGDIAELVINNALL